MIIYKPRTESSVESNPADTLILDFQPPDSEKNLLFKTPTPCFFAVEITTNTPVSFHVWPVKVHQIEQKGERFHLSVSENFTLSLPPVVIS